MRDDDSYVAFVTSRWSSLYRTSYLLTSDPGRAEDLLQTALLKTYVAWSRVAVMVAPEAYVRAILVNALISDKRRRALTSEYPRAEGQPPGEVAGFLWEDSTHLLATMPSGDRTYWVRCDLLTGHAEIAAILPKHDERLVMPE